MKTLSSLKKIKRLILASLVAFAAISSAHAQIVNFDSPNIFGSLHNFSGQGAISDPGNNVWNGIGGTGSNYTYTGGTTSGTYLSDGSMASSPVVLTLPASGSYNSGEQGAAGTPGGLLAPFIFTTNGVKTATLTNVAAGTYNLVLYGYNYQDGDRGAIFTASTSLTPVTTLATSNTLAGGTAFIAGDNYVEFNNLVVGSDGTITFTYNANTAVIGRGSANGSYNGANGEGDFNGLQLQAVVPEPSTYALLFLGVGSLIGFTVLKRRQEAA